MENKYPLPQSPEKPNTTYQEEPKTEKYDSTPMPETEVPSPYKSVQNTPSILSLIHI